MVLKSRYFWPMAFCSIFGSLVLLTFKCGFICLLLAFVTSVFVKEAFPKNSCGASP